MAEDSAARFRASLDKLLYYDKDVGTAPKGQSAFSGVDAADALSTETPSNPAGSVVAIRRRHEARPSDRRDYLRRVATFRPAVWFAKPEGLKPVDCARRGWTCVGVDALQCESCEARLLFAVPPTASNDDAKKLARLTAPGLDENHAPSCGWRGAACPLSVARFPRVPDETLREEFRSRRDALLRLEHVPEVCSIAIEDPNDVDAKGAVGPATSAFQSRFAPAAVAERVARLSTSLVTGAAHETSPARLRAATTLALCGWTVATPEASSATRVDASPAAAAAAWSPSPRRQARRAAGGKVTGSILRCALCDAKAATWNFADARFGGSGGADPASRQTREGTDAGLSPFGAKKKPKASAAALMGAMGGAFGPSVFDAAPPSAPADPGPAVGASGSGRNADAPVMSLGLSIAGGGTPSRAAGAFGGAAASPPAFGAGATRDAPFGAPGGRSSAKRKRDDHQSPSESSPGPEISAGPALTPAATPAAAALSTPVPARRPPASGSVPGDAPGAFHPLRRHRAHCPWSAPFLPSDSSAGDSTARGTGRVAAQPGWQCVLDAAAPFESADADAAAAPGAALERPPGGGGGDAARGAKPPGRLEEYTGMSGRNAVASYLAGV